MENEKSTREILPEGAYLLLEYLLRYHAREIAHMYAKENCLDDIKDVYQYYGYSEDLLDAVGWDDSSETYSEDTTDIAIPISDALESFLSIYKPGNITIRQQLPGIWVFRLRIRIQNWTITKTHITIFRRSTCFVVQGVDSFWQADIKQSSICIQNQK